MSGLPQPSALAECEAIIARGLTAFTEVGTALLRIRDERLYRHEYTDWDHYCRARWGWERNYANKQIRAAEVIPNLGTVVPIPTSERQVRPLTALPAPQQREAWETAVRESPSGTPTAREVEVVVKRDFLQVIQDKIDARRVPQAPEPKPDPQDLAAMKRNGLFVSNLMSVIRAIETLNRLPLPPCDLANEIAQIDTPDKDWHGQSRAALNNLAAIVRCMK